MLDLSGEALLTGFLAGAETSIRIGLAADGGFHHAGYHATGLVSHFASAVTAGVLLGLDEDAITAAQGITGSTAAGIQVFLERRQALSDRVLDGLVEYLHPRFSYVRSAA